MDGHRYRYGSVVARGEMGVGKMGERSQKAQVSIFKIKKSLGCNI